MKIFVIFILTLVSLHSFARDACLGLFMNEISTVGTSARSVVPKSPKPTVNAEGPHSEIFGIRTTEMTKVYQQLKDAASGSDHIGQNLLVNRNLEKIYSTLTSTKYVESGREKMRIDMIDQLLNLMHTKTMSLENFIDFSIDFLVLVGDLGHRERELRSSYSIHKVREYLAESGLLVLPLHLGEGLFNAFEMNTLWSNGILPLGIPTKSHYVDLDLKNPFDFFIHDLAHAVNRIKKVGTAGGTLSGALVILERTRVVFLEVLKISAKVPELDKYLQELVIHHLHESGSQELTSTHHFLSQYFLKSYGDIDVTDTFIAALRVGDARTKKMIRRAAKNMVYKLYRAYEFYKDHDIRKISVDEMERLIIAILIFESEVNH